MMKVTLHSELSESDKTELQRFLEQILASETLESERGNLACRARLHLYYNNSFHTLECGYSWRLDLSSSTCYIGLGTDVTTQDKLAVLGALMQYLEPIPASLVTLYSEAVGRYLLSERNQMATALIQSATPATGIAFSETASASLIDGVWMLPSGETVDVSGPEWVVCASRMSAAPVVERAPILRDPTTAETDAIAEALRATVAAPAPAFPVPFTVGQRVHYRRVPGVPEEPEGDGEVVHVFADGSGYSVRIASGTSYGFDAVDLSPITPTFSIGQRVRYSRIPHRNDPPGEGVIIRELYNRNRYGIQLSEDEYDTVFVMAEDLTLVEDVVAVEAPALTVNDFHVGQRVHWTPPVGFGQGYVAGDGMVTALGSYVDIRLDGETRTIHAMPIELSSVVEAPVVAEPPTTSDPDGFYVGQRVRFNSLSDSDRSTGEATITETGGSDSNSIVRITTDEYGNRGVFRHRLSVIPVVEADAPIEVATVATTLATPAVEDDIQF